MTPIENATDILNERAKATIAELKNEPTNIKTLQILLQGSVIPQVNAGPMAIAREFLTRHGIFYIFLTFQKIFIQRTESWPQEHVDKLKSALIQFLQVNSEALRKNKQLIEPDQIEFQLQCEQGYATMKKEMELLIKGNNSYHYGYTFEFL